MEVDNEVKSDSTEENEFWFPCYHFQISFHVPNTYLIPLNQERYMHVWIFFVVYILFVLVVSTSIRRCVNGSYDVKVLMKIVGTETFSVGFESQ